jgi:hypothetical protein
MTARKPNQKNFSGKRLGRHYAAFWRAAPLDYSGERSEKGPKRAKNKYFGAPVAEVGLASDGKRFC